MAGCLQRSVVVPVLGYPDHIIVFAFLMKFDKNFLTIKLLVSSWAEAGWLANTTMFFSLQLFSQCGIGSSVCVL